MGCNYYAHYHCCDKCGHTNKVVHIGKSSHGWHFHFHSPAYDIRCADDWRLELSTPGVVIKDEEENTVTYDDFWAMVKKKQEDPWNISHYRICRGEATTEREREYLDKYTPSLYLNNQNSRVYLDDEGHTFDAWSFT